MTIGVIVPAASDRTVPSPRRKAFAGAGALIIGVLAVCMVAFSAPAGAAAYDTSVDLGTAAPFSVLAGSTVTNTGPSVLGGELGLWAGTSVTGFPPGTELAARHQTDATAHLAQNDLTTAFNDAAGRSPTGGNIGSALTGGTVLTPGAYLAASSLNVGGAITLDGQGDPASVFIFQVPASLNTATSTSIVLTGAAQACHVFWQVGASATLGGSNAFVGTVMAGISISVGNSTTIVGRALASVGAVTLDTDTFTTPTCAATTTATTVTATPATTGGTSTLTATVRAGATPVTTGTVTFRANGVVVGTSPLGANGVATLALPAGTIPATDVITAVFNGVPTIAGSVSGPTNRVVTATPVLAVTNTPTTPVLPDTGTSDIGVLIGTGAGAIAVGAAFMVTSRRRVLSYR